MLFSSLFKLLFVSWLRETHINFLLQRSSISPAEREKYRPRTPQEPEHKKVKKEEKDIGHVSIKVRIRIVTNPGMVFGC